MPAGDGGASVSPTTLSFGDGGLVGCGTTAQSQTVAITNNTCSAFTFTNALTSGSSSYAVTPTMGMIPPMMSQTITVSPTGIPAISAVTPDLYQGTLTITTTAPGDSGHIVLLHMTAYSVTNTGNAPTTVAFAVGSTHFGIGTSDGGAPSFSIAANQSVAPVVTFSPIVVQPYTDTINTTVMAGTPLCAAPPATTLLTGQGTTGVGVQPTNLDFGLIQCGQPAAAYQTITITNTGAAITYTPSFALGINSPYTLADTSGNVIVAGNPVNLGAASSTTIRVVPKQILNPATTVADGYTDTLTITTTGAGDAPHNVSLHETAQGTIFTLAPLSMALSGIPPGITEFENFTVGNTGSLAAGYTLATAVTQGPAGTFTLPGLSSGNLSPNTSEMGVLYVKGPAPQGEAGVGTEQVLGTMTLTPNAGTILCADPPPPMPLSLTY
jgi:hypothetical protein